MTWQRQKPRPLKPWYCVMCRVQLPDERMAGRCAECVLLPELRRAS